MRIIDISMTIRPDMPVYKNRPQNRPVHSFHSKIPPDAINESDIWMSMHTGTHIDTPLHMMKTGWTAENMPLDRLLTPCRVLDLTHVEDGITDSMLEPFSIKTDDFLLFKTRNSFDETFRDDFIYLKESGAAFLADIGVMGVGTDALGIERAQPSHATHLALFNKDILIIEGLRLAAVEPGNYFLLALPLKVQGAEGAPARVVLLEGFPDPDVLNA